MRIHQYGSPDALRWEEVDLPPAAVGEALIRHTAIGVNFLDTYHRSGLYKVDSLPAVLGVEAAGVVEEVAGGSSEFAPGDRVAYVDALGAYSERRVIATERLISLPKNVSDESAAAVLLKGLTAEMLLRRVHTVEPGETILVHAAAGGVGLILCQWARALGATVIGTVGSDEKAQLASEQGCHFPIVYTREDFVERVKDLTDGNGVPVVYDGVGQATFDGSLDCLAHGGLMVSFGNASGAVPPVEPLRLSSKALFLTRPSAMVHLRDPQRSARSAEAVLTALTDGTLTASVHQRFPLRNAATAHRALEERATVGSSLLIP
jgi:NADPH2:quinone reductase